MKDIAICIPCFNESSNIMELYKRIIFSIKDLNNYKFSIIFADNSSTDNSLEIIKNLAIKDQRVGYISNLSNYGFVRSSANVLLTPNADANIFLMADLQDPPELIPKLISEWESSKFHVVFATRTSSYENLVLFTCKKVYYYFLDLLSDYKIVKNSTGYGIYDRLAIERLRQSSDSYPFIKGLVSALGFNWKSIPYKSQKRKKGISSASLPFLIDFGILGIVTLSRKPIRIINLLGITLGGFSIFLSLVVIVTKLFLWDNFAFGIAMLSVSLLFFTGSMLTALGIIGEYVGFINQRSLKLPIVIEKEKFNIP